MYKTYLIGSGYLSNKLSKKIKNSEIVPSQKFYLIIKKINKKKNKINLIINAFYSARKLNNLDSYKLFTKKSLLNISEIFDNINPKLINKVLYTSSSSVYGSIGGKAGIIDKNNRFIYSSFKLSAENLIKNFCNKNKINFDICRVFNLYGVNDNFSIISKLVESKKKNKKIQIFNNGESVRDFIHVDDIVSIYKRLLKLRESNIFDIGTGKGVKIRNIITNLNLPNRVVNFVKTKNFEIDKSIANNNFLINKINFKKFKSLENFLRINKLNYENNSIRSNYLENTLFGSIIYGAGYSGKQLHKQFRQYDKDIVSYFVDDDPQKVGKTINEIKILSYEELKELANKIQIRNIIVAIPSLNKKERTNLFKKLLPLTSVISSLPEKKFYKNNKINLDDLNKISMEEILNKDVSNLKKIDLNLFKRKSILVTGGAGSIGLEISKQLLETKLKKLIVLDQSELNIYRLNQTIRSKKMQIILGNIQDTILMKKIIHDKKIDYIFHAAAYKHVKFLEDNLYAAIKNNILGTLSLLEATKYKKVHFTFISTDKAVEPKTVLGITKRIGEILINYFAKNKNFKKSKFNIVRFGNVIGSDGSALPYFLNQIKQNLPISLTDKKMERYFMTIKEACELVLQSTKINTQNKILFLDMGKPVKIIDIIKKLFSILKKPNQKLKIKLIGNKFNEKISEKLTTKNIFYKTKYKKIYSVNEKKINNKNIDLALRQLIEKVGKSNNKELFELIKSFI